MPRSVVNRAFGTRSSFLASPALKRRAIGMRSEALWFSASFSRWNVVRRGFGGVDTPFHLCEFRAAVWIMAAIGVRLWGLAGCGAVWPGRRVGCMEMAEAIERSGSGGLASNAHHPGFYDLALRRAQRRTFLRSLRASWAIAAQKTTGPWMGLLSPSRRGAPEAQGVGA
jgi:hypothetical protein